MITVEALRAARSAVAIGAPRYKGMVSLGEKEAATIAAVLRERSNHVNSILKQAETIRRLGKTSDRHP